MGIEQLLGLAVAIGAIGLLAISSQRYQQPQDQYGLIRWWNRMWLGWTGVISLLAYRGITVSIIPVRVVIGLLAGATLGFIVTKLVADEIDRRLNRKL